MNRKASPERLRARVDRWAAALKVRPRVVRIQPMRRKWGSCSTRGTVAFAADLRRRPIPFQDFVIVHELLHLKVPTHGRVFRALLTAYVPEWRAHDLAR